MSTGEAGKLLRVHLSGHDRYRGRPLYEAIVDKCRELQIAGATVFRGMEGYGETGELHRPHFMDHHQQPVVINVVDTAENIARLLPALEEMLGTGLFATSDVMMRRVKRQA